MRLALVVLFILFAWRLAAQPEARYDLITVNEGLSQGMVYDVLESREGFLWTATKDGLNRFDGYRFEIFSPDPFDPFSVAKSELRKMHEDIRGWIWIGYEGGVDVFMPETGRFFHLPLELDFDGYVRSFVEMPDGTMWVVCSFQLWKIEAVVDALRNAAAADRPFPDFKYAKNEWPGLGPASPLAGFQSAIFTKDQTLLIGTSNGLYKMDPATGRLHPQPEILSGNMVSIIGEDPAGSLWLRTKEKILVQKKPGTPTENWEIAEWEHWRFDLGGNLWNLAGTLLKKWEPAKLAAGGSPVQVFRIGALAPSEIFYQTMMTIDRSGNVWVGTSGYGLFKVVTAKPKFASYLPLTSHRMFVEDPQGRLIPVAYPRTIYASNQFDRPQPNPWLAKLPPQIPLGMFVFDKGGNCWVALDGGILGRVDAQTKEPKLFKGIGTGLFCTREGKLLSMSEQGLLEFDPATEKFIKYPFDKPLLFNSLGEPVFNYFFEDSEGILWILAFKGLLKAAPAAGGYRFEHFSNNPNDRNTLSNDLVLSVAEDPLEPERYLWVGTRGGGLNRLDRQTGKFTHFKTGQGLPDNVVYGILTNNPGHLWLSTNKGLCRMTVLKTSSDAQATYHFKNFTAADGLQSNEFNQGSFLKMRDGTMVFGGVNGVTVFHPDSLRFNERKPNMVITGLMANNEKVDIGILGYADIGRQAGNTPISQYPNIKLSHRQNVLSLEFAALELTNPAQNQYRYKVTKKRWLGNNDEGPWVELGHKNTVQFANLQPGSYTFKVLGSNNDGIWSDAPAVLEFVIRPPWWATWWAYLLYLLAASVGVLALYRYQLRQKLEHQETLRLRELDEFKNRFFTNITHEFRTPLTVILGMAEQAGSEIDKLESERLKPEYEGKTISSFQFLASKIGLIRRNGQNLLRLINQILDLAKLESNTLKINYMQGDVLPYLRYIAESLHSLANAQNVMLRVESSETEIVMDYDPERLLQIVHNLLSNAIKFTPSGGKVVLRADLTNFQNLSNLHLTVSDTGAGIPPQDLPHIFDRFYQANNLEKAKAGGTGIGLALTKELVKAMGGEISVESEVGKGTTFMVRLPISNKAAASEGVTSSPPLTSGAAKNSGGNFKLPPELNPTDTETPSILLIEDNPDVVEYLADCLGAGGSGEPPYKLDFAYNGRAGIEKALETIPDLIISDVMMPEKDGFEVCETLKNDERTSHIPIVLLTAKAGMENRITGLKRGADAYLSKPFHREELLITLKNLLEVRRKLQAKYSTMKIPPMTPMTPMTNDPMTNDPEDAFLQKVRATVLVHLSDSSFGVDELSRALAVSQSQLHRKLVALTGKNTSQTIRYVRLTKARELLLTRGMNVSEAAYEVGFDDPKYFSRVFAEEFGVAPSKLGNPDPPAR